MMNFFIKASIILLGFFYFSCVSKKSTSFTLPVKNDSLFFYLYERNDSLSTEELITIYKSGYTIHKKRLNGLITTATKSNQTKIEELRTSAIRYNFFDLNDSFYKQGQNQCVILLYMQYKENYEKWVKSTCAGPRPLILFKEEALNIIAL